MSKNYREKLQTLPESSSGAEKSDSSDKIESIIPDLTIQRKYEKLDSDFPLVKSKIRITVIEILQKQYASSELILNLFDQYQNELYELLTVISQIRDNGRYRLESIVKNTQTSTAQLTKENLIDHLRPNDSSEEKGRISQNPTLGLRDKVRSLLRNTLADIDELDAQGDRPTNPDLLKSRFSIMMPAVKEDKKDKK